MKILIEDAPFARILPILDTIMNWINSTRLATIQAALLGKIAMKEVMEQSDRVLYSK